MYACCEVCRVLGCAIEPFLPDTARRIREQLGIKEGASLLDGVGLTQMIAKLDGQPKQASKQASQVLLHDSLRWGLLKAMHEVGKPEPLFARIETA